MQQKLGFLQESKSTLDNESMAKVDYMLSTVERSKPLYATLPEVVVRMESLQNLHQQVESSPKNLLN